MVVAISVCKIILICCYLSTELSILIIYKKLIRKQFQIFIFQISKTLNTTFAICGYLLNLSLCELSCLFVISLYNTLSCFSPLPLCLFCSEGHWCGKVTFICLPCHGYKSISLARTGKNSMSVEHCLHCVFLTMFWLYSLCCISMHRLTNQLNFCIWL